MKAITDSTNQVGVRGRSPKERCHRLPRGAPEEHKGSRNSSSFTCMGRSRPGRGSVTAHPSQGGRVLTSRPPRGAEVPPPTSKVSPNGEKFRLGEGSPGGGATNDPCHLHLLRPVLGIIFLDSFLNFGPLLGQLLGCTPQDRLKNL